MKTPGSAEITKLLFAWSAGDDQALTDLTPVVYRELHRLAHRHMAGEHQGHTFQTSALVNAAYLK
jgi:ECF sigma factor